MLPAVFDFVVLVVVVEPVFAGDVVVTVLVTVFVTVLVDVFLAELVAVLVLSGPGQAAPNKPNVKTAERAITFFIRLNSPVFFKECMCTLLFYDRPRKVVFLKLLFFGTMDNIKGKIGEVNSKNDKKSIFEKK